MRIEMIGLPGVGKTTWVEKHKEELSQHFTIIESRQPTLVNSILTRVYNFRLRDKISDPILRQKIAYRLSFQTRYGCRNDQFFYDSGQLQPIIEHAIECDYIPDNVVFSVLRMPDIILYFDDDMEKIVPRETLRFPRRFEIPEDILRERYQKTKTFLEKDILPRVNKVYKVTPQTIDNILKEITSHA